MAFSFKKFLAGIKLVPKTASTADSKGDLEVIDSTGKLGFHNGTTVSPVVTESHSAALTNKTIDADSNTITNIENADIKAAAAIDASKIADGSVSNTEFQYISTVSSNVQDQIDSKATAVGLSDHINDTVDAHDASAISVSAISGLTATEVQAALAEHQVEIENVVSDLGAHIIDTVDAHDASAISNTPSGNLAATDIQGAVNELQSDIDTRALNSDLTTHTSASTGVHGVVGSVVGTSDSQVLTNKTITGADIRTPVRSDSKQDTKANLITYALTASNGQTVFATDTKEMFQIVDGLLESIGGGAGIGGVDILFSQTFEEAAITDFTQTGMSLSTSSPIHGAISALMTHGTGASPANDKSFKQVIAVDEKFRGQAMLLELNVKSTASAGNVTIKIYDETNAANIVASEQLTLSSATGGIKDFVAFTIPATCLSLSYTITALPEAGSPVTRIDDIICQLNNAALLETSVTVPRAVLNQYSALFDGATAAKLSESLTGWITSTTDNGTGDLLINYSGLGLASIPVIQATVEWSGGVKFAGVVNVTTTTARITSSTVAGTLTDPVKYNVTLNKQGLDFTNPLTATSDVAIPLTQSGIIQEADSMIRLNSSSSMGSVATTIPRFSSTTESIGSAVTYLDSPTNGASLTVLESGVYSFSFSFESSVVNLFVGLTKNQSTLTQAINAVSIAERLAMVRKTTANHTATVSWTGYLNAGDIIRPNTSTTTASANPSFCQLTVTSQGSLKQVTVNTNSKITIPTSELRFEGASSRGTGDAGTRIIFTTQAKIRGDAFTALTGATGTLVTMKKAGVLNITSSLVAGSASYAQIIINSTVVSAFDVSPTGGSGAWGGTVAIGDIIRVVSGVVPNGNPAISFALSFQEQDIQVSVSNTLPQFSESDSCVRLTGANGFGSSATTTRRFASVVQNLGTDIEYIDSPTLGGQFIAKASGIYNVSYTENSTANQRDSGVFILVNGTSVAYDQQIYNTATIDNKIASTSWSGYLNSGDIVTGTTVPTNNGIDAKFTMSKVGRPQVTGVDVTPFVNVPQPVRQSASIGGSANNAFVTNFTTFSNTNSGLFALSADRITALKACSVTLDSSSQPPNITQRMDYYKNGIQTIFGPSTSSAGAIIHSYYQVELQAGEYVQVFAAVAGAQSITTFIKAEALSDQILTAPETFSTDTAALTYAGSGTYTLSTLANAPVGTYITFVYSINSNNRLQTTGRPTQTDADMNANGMRIYTRAYNASSSASTPPVFAIQIGKGLKGTQLNLYKSEGKVNSGELDYAVASTTAEVGATLQDYNESTGILLVDAGWNLAATTTSRNFLFSDITSQNNGYLVINASKNPALVGVGIDRVAARGVNTAGTSIANSTAVTLVYDTTKTYDTNGALNTATGIFTAPETGYYNIDSVVQYTGLSWTLGQFLSLSIMKNGTAVKSSIVVTATTGQNYGVSVSDVLFLGKNETASVVLFHNRGAASALNTAAGSVVTSFNKISGIN